MSFMGAFNFVDGSLVLYYKLDNSSGAVFDITGNLNNGTNNGATRGVPGLINNSFSFDGTNDWVNVTNNWTTGVDWSISLWVNGSDSDCSVSQYIMDLRSSSAVRHLIRCFSGSSNVVLEYDDGSQDDGLFGSNSAVFNNSWNHLVATVDSGDLKTYLNGISIQNTTGLGSLPLSASDTGSIGSIRLGNNLFFNGSVDEVGIWNRTLSVSEVLELYNSGAGLPFNDTTITDVNVTLVLPEDLAIVSENVTFNATLLPSQGFNLTNATLFIWDSSGSIFTTITNIVLGNVSNSTSFLTTNLTTGSFEWNVLGVAFNGTTVFSNFSINNRTFVWVPFSVDNEEFNNLVLETSRQDFILNITTLPSVSSVDAILNYNGTRFTADTSCSGSSCGISTAIDIPLVTTGESENKSFFWEIEVFNGTSSLSTNLSANEQNVTRLHLEACNATFTTQTLNFTSFNEATLVAIDPFIFGGTFDFWTGTGTVKRNNSIENSSASFVQLCLTPTNETFRLDGTVQYDDASSSNFTSRNYFFLNDTINNESRDIRLGLLESDDSTSFILKVQNRDILPQPDVLIFTERFYPGEGIFRTVQVSQTDDNGATVGFFKTETIDYRFVLKVNGTTVLVTTKQKIVGEDVPFTLTFTIGVDEGAAWEDFEVIDDLTSTLTFNKTSSIVSFTYLDTSGDFTSSRLIVEKVNASALQNDVVCDVSSAQSSATLTCNMTGNATGQYIARGSINRQGTSFLVNQISFGIEDFSSTAGLLGLFLGWFVILICAFMFKFNEIAGIIMINLAVIFVNLIGLIAFGYTFISALLALSVFILVVLER